MLKFSFSGNTSPLTSYSYLKVIDYLNKVDDSGFYLRYGKFNSYPPSNTGTTVYAQDQVLDLIITRDDATKAFKVYSKAAGGSLLLEYTYSDTSNNLVPFASGSGSLLGFFFDDNYTSREATAGGKVYRLRTWAGTALSQSEVDGATVVGPSVSTSSLPNATVGSSYSQTLAASGGTSPYSNWQVSSGTLPSGLTLSSSTGVISGTPTTAGTSTFSVTVDDSIPTTSAAQSLSLTVAAASAPAPAAPAPAAPAPEPVTEESTPPPPPPAPAPTLPTLDPIANQQNGNVPQAGVPSGSSLLLVNGVPSAVTVAPNAPASPTGLVVTGDGFTMRLAGLDSQGRPLGLSSDGGALVLHQDRVAQVDGTGFLPNSEVRLFVFSTPRYIGSVTTDASGNFSGQVQIPMDLEVGRHTLQANGYTPDRKVRSLSLGVQVQKLRAPRVRNASATVTFDALSAQLSKVARAQLKALAAGRKAKARVTQIEGFVQPAGLTVNDQALSKERARNVARYLRSLGVRGKIVVKGSGQARETGAAGRKVVISMRYVS
ncbi:MAG: putative Ig domain-containing protein [Actinomycetales bacterium]|nr:putative Ig domain-containing protein [Actinomycetales bacterium]